MEKSIKFLPLFFIGLWGLLSWGFYRTYLSFFPSFKDFEWIQHLHGMAMMSWVVLLIVQPFLIQKGRTELHKKIGKLSYIIAPLVVISMYTITAFSYHKALKIMPVPAAIGGLALNVPNVFSFAALYALAIWYKKNSSFHMRYMIATSLLLIGPGLGRGLIIYFNVPFELAVSITYWVTTAISVLFLGADLVKRKPWQPYTVVLIIILINQVCWESRATDWWHAFGSWWANTFF